jgi:hypothetical protein
LDQTSSEAIDTHFSELQATSAKNEQFDKIKMESGIDLPQKELLKTDKK